MKRAKHSAKFYSEGRARNPYLVRKDVAAGLDKKTKELGEAGSSTPCSRCQCLLGSRDIFKSMVEICPSVRGSTLTGMELPIIMSKTKTSYL